MNVTRVEEIGRKVGSQGSDIRDVLTMFEFLDLCNLAIQTLKTRDKARKRMAKVRRKAKGGGR